MDKLIKCLKETGVLKDGGRILGSSDGCAKQCKCSSALRFMSNLSVKHGVAIDCAIGCPGHGKCEVDAINAVDKNTIFRDSLIEDCASIRVDKPGEVQADANFHCQQREGRRKVQWSLELQACAGREGS